MKVINVGALWLHKKTDEATGNTKEWCTGYLELGLFGRVRIAMHSNTKKMNGSHPDYIITRCDFEENAE